MPPFPVNQQIVHMPFIMPRNKFWPEFKRFWPKFIKFWPKFKREAALSAVSLGLNSV